MARARRGFLFVAVIASFPPCTQSQRVRLELVLVVASKSGPAMWRIMQQGQFVVVHGVCAVCS